MQKQWLSRAVLLLAVGLISWAALVSWKELGRHARIRAEVTELEQEALRIRKENETLSERIGYFSTQEFREQEAKKKLGLKKPDETVVALKEEQADADQGASAEPASAAALERERALYLKWWDLFAGPH